MQNIIIKENKDLDYSGFVSKYWLPKSYVEIMFKSIAPKLIALNTSEGTTNIESYINQKNPFNHLNYANEDAYLISHNLTKNKVIEQSIKHVLKDIDEYDLNTLTDYFRTLVQTKKVRVFDARTANEKAIYIEIINSLNYINKTQNLLIKNQNSNRGDHFGTGFRKSSLQKIVDVQIGHLEKRLEGSHFSLVSADEINHTNQLIKMLKKSQEKNYENIFEYFHIVDQLIGLDIDIFDLTDNEKESYKQLLAFHNGILSSDIELIRSSMIVLNMIFYQQNYENREEYANLILNITMYFFHDKMSEINSIKNQLTFTTSHIDKPYTLKTTLDGVSIYKYSQNENPLGELFEIGFNSLIGAQNKFDQDAPHIDNLSDFIIQKRLVSTLKNELGFNTQDIRVLFYFYKLIEKGNFPSPQFFI